MTKRLLAALALASLAAFQAMAANPDAAASEAMNFVEADRTPELELNEILWRSIHGPTSAMPPPRHAAFIRTRAGADGDEDDDWLDRMLKIRK